MEYLDGVPRNVLSDNMKQMVSKNMRYEYKFQELADHWAVHYNTNLEATRPRKPKDKPTVENSVYQSYLRTSSIFHGISAKLQYTSWRTGDKYIRWTKAISRTGEDLMDKSRIFNFR